VEGGVNGIAIIGSEVEWFFGVFFPQDVPGNCRKDMVFRGVFGRLEPALDTRYFGMHVVMWFFNFLIKQPKGGRPREGGIPRMGI